MSDIKEMTIGQVVDFVVDYNRRHERNEEMRSEEESRPKRHLATQAEIDAFFG